MIIYKATNKVNGKVYIGQTRNSLEYRRSQHERDCKYHRNSYFHEALIKYGTGNFEWEVIDCSDTQDGIDELEKKYIQEYESTNREKGYNLKLGGREGGLYNDECRRRLGESTKRKWDNPEIARKMMDGLRKGTETVKEMAKTNWIKKVCPICGNIYKVKPAEKKRYCSYKCSTIGEYDKCISNIKKAKEINMEKHKKNCKERSEKIFEWVLENKDYVLSVPFNKVSTCLHVLAELIGVKDFRTVVNSIGAKNKKEFLIKIKEYLTYSHH